MKKISFWLENARNIALPQSILPALLSIAMAATHDNFSWWLSLIALFGVICAHLGMNLADDYFDYKKDSTAIRERINAQGMRAHIDKCHYLTSGAATVKELVWAIYSFLLLAGVAGAVLFYFRGVNIAILALIGLFLGISYSGFPFRFSYHGLGELLIGLMFGPLLMLGMQYAACGVFSTDIILLSVAIGLLVTNIVYSHSILDFKADEKAGKMTFARLLHTRKGMLACSAIFNVLPFLLVVVGVLLQWLHWSCLLVLPLMPLGIYLVYSLACFIDNKEIDATPKWWMGPMGDFEKYRAANMDWFLIRWLVARNIVTFFSLILAIIYIVLALA